MDTAKKRQNIIIVAAVLMSLYGVFDLTGPSRAKHPGPAAQAGAEDLKAFITRTSAQISGERASTYDEYVIDRAGSIWGRDPFSGKNLTGPESGSEAKDKTYPRPVFVYNGYVERDGQKVAVINNREYLAGDQLKEKSFFVKKISPARVLIKNKTEGSEFEIPLSELE